MSIKTVLLMGRPGSGKGTQAHLLSEKTGWRTLSSGDRLREMRALETPLGKKVKEDYDAGKYLPDWFADYLLEKEVFELSSSQGVILEGFGRTKTQAEHITDIFQWLDRPFVVIHIDVPADLVVERMLERAKTENRPDSDTPEKIHNRLKRYDENTKESLEFYRANSCMKVVDGSLSVEEVHKEIITALELI
jgi:adenylate kinase